MTSRNDRIYKIIDVFDSHALGMLAGLTQATLRKIAEHIDRALAPRVFPHGADIPPGTYVMDEDGQVHPDRDSLEAAEGFGAHLGTLVEVMGPDEWQEHADSLHETKARNASAT